jgi:hypothetical protein
MSLSLEARIEEALANEWWNLGDTTGIKTANVFRAGSFDEAEKPHVFLLDVLRKPENFWLTCKLLFNVTLVPFQLAILRELWLRPFPMLVASRGAGKSFMLAIYAMLRGLFNQGAKIVIVGAAFRQAKVVFEYCENIWANSPVLRDLAGEGTRNQPNGPRRDIDRCVMRLGESTITSLPLGTGEKIRGQRANVIIAEEFACLGPETVVETDRGLVRIGEYAERVPEGTPLLTGDPETPSEAPAVYYQTPPAVCYRVTTRFGLSFVCSEVHQVETEGGWKLARELTPDEDRLPLTNQYRFPAEKVSKDGMTLDGGLARLMGVFAAGGGQCGPRYVSFAARDAREAAGLRRLLARAAGAGRVSVVDRGEGGLTVYCHDLEFRRRLLGLGLEQGSVPWSVLMSPRDVVVEFLRGAGRVLFRPFVTPGGQFHGYAQVSGRQFGLDLQTLMLKLGVLVRLYYRPARGRWCLRAQRSAAPALHGILKLPGWGRKLRRAFPQGFPAYRLPEFVKVVSVERLPDRRVLYDYGLPKTQSFYGAGLRQHNSIPVDIFETVVSGFAAVSLSPVEKLQREARLKAMRRLGLAQEQVEPPPSVLMSNQSIICGTAYYAFNHFASYWKKWKAIVESRGDRSKLEEIFNGEVPEGFDWRDYSIVRIPSDMLPPGFMDQKVLSKAKATYHVGSYQVEFGAVFSDDSHGFFKRSLIEACVVGKPGRAVHLPSCGEVRFAPVTRGHPQRKYVLAIDPASEQDNFSVVVLELWPDHRRVVHSWTTTRKRHVEKVNKGLVQEKDFYGYAARKIRELLKAFPCDRIIMDLQGGGVAVMEALHDPDKLRPGELPIWPVVDEEKPGPHDREPGLHILELANFSKADWVAEANHGLRKDMEDRVLLFPEFDAGALGIAIEADALAGRVHDGESGYDSLEDAYMEIEALKDELATIVHTQTSASMRDRWDTPEVKQPGGKKGRLRKDRYTSLLMANMLARTLAREPSVKPYSFMGGFARDLAGSKKGGASGPRPHHANPDWYRSKVTGGGYGAVARRR